jgi:hypothetical protein
LATCFSIRNGKQIKRSSTCCAPNMTPRALSAGRTRTAIRLGLIRWWPEGCAVCSTWRRRSGLRSSRR